MAGTGIEVKWNEKEFDAILNALSKAAMPDMKAIADFAGGELDLITKEAFEKEKDPVKGQPWQPLKKPRGKGSKHPGTTNPILDDSSQLKRAQTWEAFGDGSVIYGNNMIYGNIHQKGGAAGKGKKSLIPARPYLGVPGDFDRRVLNDPAVLKLLGL
ncbi:MAG: phage virion morphogenesis protein [Spirochaetales bacterium]|nr:phage virion morphogenesis protein [Spirochaetales bacterium]